MDVVAREGETSGSKPLAYPVIVEAPVKTATEARQGRATGVVRWVLGLSPDARNHRHDPRSSRSSVSQEQARAPGARPALPEQSPSGGSGSAAGYGFVLEEDSAYRALVSLART